MTCATGSQMPWPRQLTRHSVEKGARRLETLRVVTVVQTIDADPAVGRWRMYETRIADIDADVRERLVARIEEDQVARP